MSEEPISCCAACQETYRMVKDMHQGLDRVSKIMAEVGSSPMGKMFGKQMGVDMEALTNGHPVG